MNNSIDVDAFREVRAVRQRTRAHVGAFWFPLMLFGTISLISAPIVGIGEGQALGIYWLIAGPAGIAVTAFYFHRRELRVGVGRNGLPYMATASGILLGTSASGWYGGITGRDSLAEYGPPLVVALGYLIFARLEKSAPLALLGTAWLLFSVALLLANPSEGTSYLAAGFGISAIVLGAYFLRQSNAVRDAGAL